MKYLHVAVENDPKRNFAGYVVLTSDILVKIHSVRPHIDAIKGIVPNGAVCVAIPDNSCAFLFRHPFYKNDPAFPSIELTDAPLPTETLLACAPIMTDRIMSVTADGVMWESVSLSGIPIVTVVVPWDVLEKLRSNP